jgi:hypothetical protein
MTKTLHANIKQYIEHFRGQHEKLSALNERLLVRGDQGEKQRP